MKLDTRKIKRSITRTVKIDEKGRLWVTKGKAWTHGRLLGKFRAEIPNCKKYRVRWSISSHGQFFKPATWEGLSNKIVVRKFRKKPNGKMLFNGYINVCFLPREWQGLPLRLKRTVNVIE